MISAVLRMHLHNKSFNKKCMGTPLRVSAINIKIETFVTSCRIGKKGPGSSVG